jgi:pantetheine-phosphate adenylyltransferase
MLAQATGGFKNLEIASFEGLLVDYASARGARMILRGIRAVSDYELEWQMALMNRRLRPEIETVFLTAGEEFSFISSKLVKEVASLGGVVTGIVPAPVEARLRQKFAPR